MNKLIQLTLLSLFSWHLASSTAYGYLEIAESGDITPNGTFKAGVGPQIRMTDPYGTNLTGYLESGIREDLSWRATLGGGETKFFLGGSLKWIPFPDLENQPAMGARADLNFASADNVTATTFRIAPLLSKGMATEYVYFTPYVALPIGIASASGTTTVFSQLVLASDISINDAKDWLFNVELGSNLSKSFSYFSLNVFYYFDAKEGIKVNRSK